jgi:hypothetical protein
MDILTEHTIEPHGDRILPMSALGERWGCDSRVAAKRAKDRGLRFIRWNSRVVCVRLSDVIAAEEKATL